MRRIISVALVIVFVVAFCVLPSTTQAQNLNSNRSLVALGDSITSGYGLKHGVEKLPGNTQVSSLLAAQISKEAYPQLLGDQLGYRVHNLAVSGWTSERLLSALQNESRYRNAVREANLLILNIGGNDVLGYLRYVDFDDPDLNALDVLLEIMERLTVYYYNLGSILNEIRTLNSEVPILYYGLYNPLDSTHPFSVAFGYQELNILIGAINHFMLYGYDDEGLQNPFGATSYAEHFGNIHYVDALQAFELFVLAGGSKTELLIDEVHPGVRGHELLYQAGLLSLP